MNKNSDFLNIDTFFSHAHDAMLVIDPYDDKFIAINDEASRLLGYAKNGIKDIRVSYIFEKSFANLLVFTESVVELEKSWSNNLRCTTRMGDIISIETSGSLLKTNQHIYLILTLRDANSLQRLRNIVEVDSLYRHGLTRWKTIEAVFEEIERENQLILSAVGEGIYGVNANGETTFVNPAAERMLGWPVEELIGRNIHAAIHHTQPNGKHYHSSKCPIYASTHDGEVHHIDNEIFWRKDGSWFPVEYTSTPIRDNGRLVGAVVIFRDISDRKQADKKLHTALAEVQALRNRLEQENAYLQEEISAEHNYKEIVGKSEVILNIIQQIELVAPTGANVLITGESGTGKELIARAIHQSSERCNRPLIRVNCASVPRELFESEFFGHIKGAFTGAIADRIGRFELADGGTLFLDEVGEIPIELQSKLLRVLQEQQFERIGDNQTKKIDVRIIAATNKDLKKAVSAGGFREDLFYRLNVFPIISIPLRERIADIPLLALHFTQRATLKFNKPEVKLSVADIQRLQAYTWPGNIRELVNVIERAIILSRAGKLVFDLPKSNAVSVDIGKTPHDEHDIIFTETERHQNERKNIIKALKISQGKVFGSGGAAELLDVKPTTLTSRIKKLGINRVEFQQSA